MTEPRALDATLSTETFEQLRALIREETGIEFPDEKRYLLESRVRPRLLACEVPDFEAYVQRLTQKNDRGEIRHLLNAVTINETSFFRHPAQFKALKDDLLPDLVGQREHESTVRLWSAACSAGDEAYSLAIIVKEWIQPRFPSAEFEIVGTDINTEVLEMARRGRYRKRAIRNVPTEYLEKYFGRVDDTFVLDSSIRDMVKFRSLNLTDDLDMRRMGNFDVIMCANVLIYFAEGAKRKVLRSLHRALRPGGYLFVGGSEALGDVGSAFEPVQKNGALFYKRPCTASSTPLR